MTERAHRTWLAVILLVTALLYAPSLGNGFAGDDMVAQAVLPDSRTNPMIAELQGLGEYFTSHYWRGLNATSHLFRPVTVYSYALVHAVFGPAAWPQHLCNVLLHLAAVVLVWRLLLELRLRASTALLGAAVFALHAIHSEVVAGIVGRAELLAFALGATATLAWCRALERRRCVGWASLGALAMFGAYCSKENGLAWAAYLPLFAWAKWRRHAVAAESSAVLPAGLYAVTMRGGFVVWCAVALLPALLFFGLRANMLAGLPEETPIVAYVANPLHHVDAWTRVLTATQVLGFAMWQCLMPFELNSDWGAEVFTIVQSVTDVRFWLPASLIVALGTIAILRRRTAPLGALAVATFFGFAFVTSNLPFAIGTIYGERLYYTPSLAISIGVAMLAQRTAASTALRRLCIALAVCWLGANGLQILVRNPVWADSRTLLTTDAAGQPRSVRLQYNMAQFALADGDVAKAQAVLAALERLQPEEARVYKLRARIALVEQRYADAERDLRRALAARYYEPLADGHEVHEWLAAALLALDRHAEAIDELQRAIALRPNYLPPIRTLLLVGRGVVDRDVLTRAIGLGQAAAPADPFWELQRGHLALDDRLADVAERSYRDVLRRVPNHAEGALGLAHALAAQGKFGDAMALCRSIADSESVPAEIRDAARGLRGEIEAHSKR